MIQILIRYIIQSSPFKDPEAVEPNQTSNGRAAHHLHIRAVHSRTCWSPSSDITGQSGRVASDAHAKPAQTSVPPPQLDRHALGHRNGHCITPPCMRAAPSTAHAKKVVTELPVLFVMLSLSVSNCSGLLSVVCSSAAHGQDNFISAAGVVGKTKFLGEDTCIKTGLSSDTRVRRHLTAW
jgi:hypothetical protein